MASERTRDEAAGHITADAGHSVPVSASATPGAPDDRPETQHDPVIRLRGQREVDTWLAALPHAGPSDATGRTVEE